MTKQLKTTPLKQLLVVCYRIDDHTVVIFYQQLAFYGHYELFETTLKV